MNRTHLSSRIRSLALAGALLGTAGLLNACNDAQSGALLGAGVGALAGQAIGGDTKATLIGTAVGAWDGRVTATAFHLTHGSSASLQHAASRREQASGRRKKNATVRPRVDGRSFRPVIRTQRPPGRSGSLIIDH